MRYVYLGVENSMLISLQLQGCERLRWACTCLGQQGWVDVHGIASILKPITGSTVLEDASGDSRVESRSKSLSDPP